MVHDPEPRAEKARTGADVVTLPVTVTHRDALEISAAVIAALVSRRAVEVDLTQSTSGCA